jgi:hypothetical protein
MMQYLFPYLSALLASIYGFCTDLPINRTNRGAEGIGGRVKFLPLAWAGMPKTSFRKNSDSPQMLVIM